MKPSSAIFLVKGGAITPLGDLEDLWRGLLQGRVAFKPAGRSRPYVAAHCEVPARDPELSMRRCMALALESTRELGPGSARSDRCALVFASTKGEVDQWELQRALRVKPLETGIVLSEMASELARRLGIAGRVLATSTACASGSFAAIEAAELLEDGDVEEALVVGADALSLFIEHGFGSLKAVSLAGARPFDASRDGLTLGEAGAAVRLSLRAHGGMLGRLVSFGASNDANHISGPSRDGLGLALAIQRCLKGQDAGRIKAICAHGTATRYNDAMEAHAFHRVFGRRIPPVFSIKGNIGHTLGAAGVVELLVSALVAGRGVIPRTAGFTGQAADEPSLDVVHGGPREVGPGLVLSTNSGFGGMNTALLVGPPEVA